MSLARDAKAHRTSGGDNIIVVGSGLAGLATALLLAPLPVVLVTQGRIFDASATAWAQGGIAAAVSEADAPWRHAEDSLAAGAGLSDPRVVEAVTSNGRHAMELLETWGVQFDREVDGRLSFASEGAHSHARILHADADRSGMAILKALASAVRRTPSIEVVEGFVVDALIRRERRVIGVRGQLNRQVESLEGSGVVLATGGVTALFASTTNPLSSWGSGLWLAAREGAVMRDLEFVQFHPTAIAIDEDPAPLASEALRGEGARLVDARGCSIFNGDAASELSTRDIVARAVAARTLIGEAVFLDATRGRGMRIDQRFPAIAERCRAVGIDPVSDPIPVKPAAHYHMGGIKVDLRGRTSLQNLWACGEVACTSLHGANRLASNSLLEAVVFAEKISQDVRARTAGSADVWTTSEPVARAELTTNTTCAAVAEVRGLMDTHVGVIRNRVGLTTAIARFWSMRKLAASKGRVLPQVEVALLIATAAARRVGSIGAHFRSDDPGDSQNVTQKRDITLGEAFVDAQRLCRDFIEPTTQCQLL